MSGAAPVPAAAGRPLVSLSQVAVTKLAGIGSKKAEALAEIGIETVFDLLTHYPRRYVDRSLQASIADVPLGEEATILATVRRVNARRTRQRRSLVEVDASDGRSYLRVTFFNQHWRAQQLAVGTQAVFSGRLEAFRGRRQLTNPLVDLVGDRTGRIVPIYPQSERAGVTSDELGTWIDEALRRAGDLEDPLPPTWRHQLDLVGRTEAMRGIHRPESLAETRPARQRLAFDELLRLQVELVARKRATERDALGIRHQVEVGGGARALLAPFRASLPFTLTEGQERALGEILADLAGPHPMHRLLQGDVGSGKTVVAVVALLVAVQGGHQGAFLAPTEVLAEQHLQGVRELVSGLWVADPETLSGERPVRVELFTSANSAAERSRLQADLRSGRVDLAVGTHALLTEEVGFRSLGVVVIDEQHRFGVEQRAVLAEKGRREGGSDPDLLVMTATPIPRTAAMTVFGDLDVTVIRDRPPGRTPVRTVWARGPLAAAAAWAQVRDEVAGGRRAYVVCPLVEGSPRVEAASAVEEAERLGAGELAGLRLGLLHGQLASREKEAVMGRFRRGELDVLVATTVIEVGVDVPAASVMVVQDAGRFGMAQLHQLRGRVGRGQAASWCFLLGEGTSPEAEARLKALESTDDGFELAEIDLELRGEGTILGTRQKGRSDLKLASLRRDKALVSEARRVAFDLVGAGDGLARHPALADEVRLLLAPEDADFLFRS